MTAHVKIQIQTLRDDARTVLLHSIFGGTLGTESSYPNESCIVNRQVGDGDSKYVIIFDPVCTGHVILRMRSGS